MKELVMTSWFVMKVCKNKHYTDLDHEVDGEVVSYIDSVQKLFPDINKFDQWEEVEVKITIKRIEEK